MNTEQLKQEFPFQGGPELAQAAINHFGESIIGDILPIYRAICLIPGSLSSPIACLAEAIQYRNVVNLANIAEFGLDIEKMHLLEYGQASHGIAIRAEAVKRVMAGEEPCYSQLIRDHDYTEGKPPFITHDRDVMDFIARRSRKATP